VTRFFLVVAALAAAAHAEPVLTLEDASARALATHERLRAAEAERARAAVAPWRAYAALGPSIRDVPSYTRVKEAIVFPTGGLTIAGFNPVVIAQDVLRNALEVGQPLYTHQFWGLRDIGTAEVRRSDDAYRAAREDILLAVAAAYYDALRAQTLVDVAQATERLADTEIEHANVRLTAGEALRTDVLRARTTHARADERLADAAGQLAVARDQLRRLAGLDDAPFELVDPPARRLELATSDPFVATAATRNPDLRQREAALAEARGEERRRIATLYPTLGMQFDYQNLNNESFADRNDFWTLMVRAQVPLLEAGGTRWLDVSEQRAVVDRLEAEVAGFRRDLAVDVRRAWTTARTLDARRAAAADEVSLATESYRMLSDQYRSGVATNLDVLAALTVLTDARGNEAALRYAHAVSLVQLERVVGTLGEVDGPEPHR